MQYIFKSLDLTIEFHNGKRLFSCSQTRYQGEPLKKLLDSCLVRRNISLSKIIVEDEVRLKKGTFTQKIHLKDQNINLECVNSIVFTLTPLSKP